MPVVVAAAVVIIVVVVVVVVVCLHCINHTQHPSQKPTPLAKTNIPHKILQVTTPHLQHVLLLLQALQATTLAGNPQASDAVEALWSWSAAAVNGQRVQTPDCMDALAALIACAAPMVAAYAPAALTAVASSLVEALLRCGEATGVWNGVVSAIGAVVHAAQELGWTVPSTVCVFLPQLHMYCLHYLNPSFPFTISQSHLYTTNCHNNSLGCVCVLLLSLAHAPLFFHLLFSLSPLLSLFSVDPPPPPLLSLAGAPASRLPPGRGSGAQASRHRLASPAPCEAVPCVCARPACLPCTQEAPSATTAYGILSALGVSLCVVVVVLYYYCCVFLFFILLLSS